MDVVDQTGARYYVTVARNTEREQLIRSRLGDTSILLFAGSDGAAALVYLVNRGAMPLARIFETAPFSEAYMARLHERAQKFLEQLGDLDGGIDVKLDELVFTYDESSNADPSADDSFLAILPSALA